MEWGNVKNWLSGDARSQELRDTRELWSNVERLWRASPLASTELSEIVLSFVREAISRADRVPATPIVVALCEATEAILRTEDITPLEANWSAIDNDVACAVEFREMLTRRRRWAADFSRMNGIVRERFLTAYQEFFESLPEPCFGSWSENEDAFGVSLIELLEDPAEVIQRLTLFPYDDDTLRYELFRRLRMRLVDNMLVASGFPTTANLQEVSDRLIIPSRHKSDNAIELADLYLAGTPFIDVLSLPVPFHIGDEARFEHCHIIGGTGHGKTQLMQRMIHADLVRAQRERRAVVVIDSQGDLINKLMRLELFDPDAPDSLADRLVVIDPADVEFPAALNLFDAHLDRLRNYRPVDRERVLNGVIELYEVFFGEMLGAELTQKQGVIFRYLARLMITIPGATIHTLMQLMEDGKPFKPQMEQLDGSARYFFQTEFFQPSFSATKKQILRRLWGVLSTPAFERMFAQTRNKLDLFAAMNDGKIIFISTAKDLLKQDGSALFGRFFVAMLAQAALERSTLDPDERTPTFVYVDEAQEYFDDSTETILNQARKYRVSLTLAHQTLDQLSPRLRSAINSNTSMKCVGGVSAKDARALADDLRTSSDFIESMRRRGERTEFAVWLKQMTPHAIRLSVPLGFLERQPLLTEEAFEAIMNENRARYCGTLADVVGFSLPEVATLEPQEVQPRREPQSPPDSIYESEPTPLELEAAKPKDTPAVDRERVERPTPDRSPVATRELGKGGSQHRYVQHLIKQLAEERGLRAVIEEAVDGGRVDVGLHQGEVSVACEISVTSTPEYEAQNLAKCLRAGFARVWAIAPDGKRRKAVQQMAEARLGPDAARIEFFTTEEMIEALDALVVPEPEEKVVKGYRVRTTRKAVSPAEAKERRANIARILSQSARADR